MNCESWLLLKCQQAPSIKCLCLFFLLSKLPCSYHMSPKSLLPTPIPVIGQSPTIPCSHWSKWNQNHTYLCSHSRGGNLYGIDQSVISVHKSQLRWPINDKNSVQMSDVTRIIFTVYLFFWWKSLVNGRKTKLISSENK